MPASSSLFILGAALAATSVNAQEMPGDLDLTFGNDGIVVTDFDRGSERGFGIAIQQDDKIVVAGGQSDFDLARYNTDGTLDTSFDGDGKVTTSFGVFDQAFAVAIQPDGKIIAGGTSGLGDFALARYNEDGSLDPTFDGDGKVTTNLATLDEVRGLVIQPDGKIVAAGLTESVVPSYESFAIARYNPDGSLDATFDGDGVVITDLGGIDEAEAVALEADGRIVAAGLGGPLFDFALARYNADGSLDASFGAGGLLTTDFGNFDSANGIVIQPDGKIVVAGVGGNRFALARYNADGSLDTSFDGDGKVMTEFNGENIESANGLVLQANKKIVAIGTIYTDHAPYFALARYDSHGSLDPSFGTGGKVTTSFAPLDEDVAEDVAIQPDGKIVLVGGAGPCIPPCSFGVARYVGDPVCEARIQVDGDVYSPGMTVPVRVYIAHHRSKAVTVPWEMRLTDASGQRVVSHTTQPHTFEPGEVVDRNVEFRLPKGLAGGTYTLELVISGMADTNGAATTLRVVQAE